MLAVLEHFDHVPRVARRIGGDEDRFDVIVLHHLFERRIRLLAAGRLGQPGAAIGNQVADGDDLDVGMILKPKRRRELANAVADEADANLAIGDWLPPFGRIVRGRRFSKPWIGFSSPRAIAPKPAAAAPMPTV